MLDSEIDPGFVPWIRLYGPNGALLANNWGVWVAYLAVTAPLSGTYTVVVGTNDAANDAVGKYQLTLAKIQARIAASDTSRPQCAREVWRRPAWWAWIALATLSAERVGWAAA